VYYVIKKLLKEEIMPGPGAYWIGEEESKEVMDVMASGYLFRYGRFDDEQFKGKVYTFERELEKYCNVNYAQATSSGTVSLLISLLALGIQPGDEVIVPTFGFVATYSAAIFAGAVPVLCDIDESFTIDPSKIEEKISSKTRVIVPVHALGNPSEMDSILTIARKHNLAVLEDSCQAAGGSYRGKKLGAIGDMGVFSLNIFKTMTAGEGGVVLTNDKELYEHVFGLHDQGYKPVLPLLEIGQKSILGLNFRVNELTGAVALAQLRKLDDIMSTLRQKKKKLKNLISDIPGLTFRRLNDETGECGTLCTVIFEDAQMAANVAEKLETVTMTDTGWHVYANMDHVNRHLKSIGQPYGRGAYPVTDDLLSRSINLSVGVVDAGLGSAFGININSSDEDIERVADQFRTACA
jgi:dTDP-4-amino-4,6-dideoxygalactose transaminase